MSPGTTRLGRLRDWLLDLLYPPHCLGCGAAGAWLCAECLSRVPRVDEPRLVAVALERGSWPLPVYSVSVHRGLPRQAVHALKYEGKRVLAGPMGAEMAEVLASSRRSEDMVVPVPLHESRRRDRGYNQAELLARAMADQLGLPLGTGLLVRVRETPPQVGLSVPERRANMAGAFRADDRMRGHRAVLVDDVCTTGATIAACAAALAEVGATPVAAVTFTRAGSVTDDL